MPDCYCKRPHDGGDWASSGFAPNCPQHGARATCPECNWRGSHKERIPADAVYLCPRCRSTSVYLER